MNNIEIREIVGFFKSLQNEICISLEEVDGKASFQSDLWNRKEGGGGDTRVIQDGAVFEKGGVNFSHVYGAIPGFLKKESKNGDFFQATGVSIVIHPKNPFVPIIHMNVRYFEMSDREGGTPIDFWFGGGIDLSPAYVFQEDATFFHNSLKTVCDRHDQLYYPKFKKWCDEYFYIQHRNEMRGIGGVFFDHLRASDGFTKSERWEFIKDVGNAFAPIYAVIANKNKEKAYTDQHKKWQKIRRGRYTEFNLVYDRGTHFGLKTNGRIESILMSLPPEADWNYNYHPKENSEEYRSLSHFQPKSWIS